MLSKTPASPQLRNSMTRSSASSGTATTLRPLVAVFVEATNSFDLERLMITFADDVLANDQPRDYRGKAAIRGRQNGTPKPSSPHMSSTSTDGRCCGRISVARK
jgi:ketosteroid isomerase-like protein